MLQNLNLFCLASAKTISRNDDSRLYDAPINTTSGPHSLLAASQTQTKISEFKVGSWVEFITYIKSNAADAFKPILTRFPVKLMIFGMPAQTARSWDWDNYCTKGLWVISLSILPLLRSLDFLMSCVCFLQLLHPSDFYIESVNSCYRSLPILKKIDIKMKIFSDINICLVMKKISSFYLENWCNSLDQSTTFAIIATVKRCKTNIRRKYVFSFQVVLSIVLHKEDSWNSLTIVDVSLFHHNVQQLQGLKFNIRSVHSY